MYDNSHDANLYLVDSVIRFQDKPVYVTGARDTANGKVALSFLFMKDVDKHEAVITDERFNFHPVPLGYTLDSLGRATYVARQPSRTWKQGLSDKNIMNCGHEGRVCVRNIPDWKSIHNCIIGTTKPIKKAIEEGGIISRDLFIRDDHSLFFKGKKIGMMKGSVPVLLNEYIFMDKYVEEVFGK